MQSTPGVNRAFLAAAWGLMAGISATLVFQTSGWLFVYNAALCFISIFGAILCAANVNNERWPARREPQFPFNANRNIDL